ncbi:NAD(P)/FAD-dependent oxidoreductase [Marinobacter sp. MDS2]|uniref:phytoene desaturase family protein n=1 Tax=Marinobacter sp. MDS2 TaxID=3065961 RepID=UPI00273BB8F6|nr:NAD(P)/FAD-dependent oxidoreductase [Marinobacter sp. MDS2]MDP4548053.1 NAD(P)/FAD-dependent oxidoreductase [Marinobacter sp. MDS2]
MAEAVTPKKLKPSTIRIGTRYRANRLKGPYDAIVIGSGIGGLTAAACLSRAGKKVLVLEQHYTAGGYTHSYARNGYEWDVGVHYIGDMGVSTTLARRLFDYITDSKLKWAPMDENYDRFFLGDKVVNLRAGKEGLRHSLLSAFPEEGEAIDRYVALLDQVTSGMQWYTLSKLSPSLVSPLVSKGLNKVLPDCFNRNTYDVLRDLTDNEELIAAITGQWGDCGVTPKQSSFMIHAIIAKHYLHGGYYPVGGASEIAKTIIPGIQAAGGEVFTYADVTDILIEKGKAVGVRMADGEEIRAPKIISGAGVINTYERLLPKEVSEKVGYPQDRKNIKPSMAHIGLYIGLKGTPEELGLPRTNFWIYPGPDHDASVDNFLKDPHNAPFPVVYLSFPAAKDPDYQNRWPGTSTLEVVAPTSWEMFESWQGTTWGKRGEEYEALKAEITDRLLEEVYDKLPQLRGKIDYVETSTPLSTAWFCRYEEGELYGLDHTPERFEQRWLRPKTDIPGLYLTGQDILTCGLVGAMIGGLITTLSIQGLKGAGLAKRIFVG